MAEFQEEQPTKATSKTVVLVTEINQSIAFYYDDPTEIYYSYSKADMLDDLLDDITTTMQNFLSNDKVKVNGEHIPLVILDTQLTFHKKKHTEPILTFSIISDGEFRLKQGENSIELEAEPDTLDYPITSSWRFPGKVIQVTSPLRYKIAGFNIFFEANATEQIGGEEKYIFLYSKQKK